MNKFLISAAAVMFAAGAAWAGAHGSMSDKRVDAMKSIGGSMKAIGEGNGDAVQHAQNIKMQFGDMLEKFPEGSMEYRAKANIWTDWSGFEAAMGKSNDAAAKLVTAAEGGDSSEIGNALKNLGGTCKGCHEEYRGPKPE
ncbi:MAG: c-type cytochrome [Minwuia sp.]|uniref:c-type cytochrome n=1 Tax=Minwuia sp. TaxID=2493630 RepID=UPI003A841F94